MTDAAAPIVELTGVTKGYQSLRPLRIASLRVRRGERFALSGFDAGAAETLVHLITGAAVPDEGDVRVGGHSTRDIATDTEWLASLDRFGIVTERAVLLESLPVAANLALPFTLSIDPLSPETTRRVEALAAAAEIPAARLAESASTLTPAERLRVHLARALALDPWLLLLEHPTARLEPVASTAFGDTLRRIAEPRGLGWLAVTEDEPFARAAGGTRLRLKPATGELVAEGLFARWWGKT